MKEEKREATRNDRPDGLPPGRQEALNERDPDLQRQRVRMGPISSAAGWLGSAFNRTSIDKHEAEERRSRRM